MPSLVGPQARVATARSQIETLDGTMQQFLNANRCRIGFGKSRTAGKCDIRVFDVPGLPLDIGIAVGLIAHNLRAALDELVCQLALLVADSEDVECICAESQFPISIDGPRSRRRRKFTQRSPSLKNVRRYVAQIDGLQPYKRRNGGRSSPLWMLQDLNNTDKHRVIVVVSVAGIGTGMRGIMRPMPDGGRSFFASGIRLTAGRVLKDGAKIRHIDCTSPENVNVQVVVVPEIVFGKSCRAVKRLSVTATLRQICGQSESIFNGFAPEFA